MQTFEAGLHTLAPLPWAVHFTCALGSNKGRADIRGIIYTVLYEAHKMVRIVGDILGSASCTMAKQCYLQLTVCACKSVSPHHQAEKILVLQTRAHYGLSTHPKVMLQYPAKV